MRLSADQAQLPATSNQRIGVYSSTSGSLVRVEIERASGIVRVDKAYNVVECGQALVPEVMVGQAQGCFAMGIGHALRESLPHFEDGPGNGRWNHGQYDIARASDLPLNGLEGRSAAGAQAERFSEGHGGGRDDPVVPAILNAIYDATGRRFQSLPVTRPCSRECSRDEAENPPSTARRTDRWRFATNCR